MEISIAKILKEMIKVSKGNTHDIDHFIRVWTYAKTIAELEEVDEKTKYIIEVASITHDIACPLCREKYGNTNGKNQEIEGEILVNDFLSNLLVDTNVIERVKYLVAHHHSFNDINGIDYQILIEADYIANAIENKYSKENITNFSNKFIKTKSAKEIIESIF